MDKPDKRTMDRYDLSVPAFISLKDVIETETEAAVGLKTRNICSGGAFFITDNPFQIDTKLDIDIRISLFDEVSRSVKESDVHVSGSVVRIDNAGMAVKFDKNFKIAPAA